jgi:signal transduction histidine kinase/CheY-like chemotaxis protein
MGPATGSLVAALGAMARLGLSRAGPGANLQAALGVLRPALGVQALLLCEHEAEGSRLVIRVAAGAPSLAGERLPVRVGCPLSAALVEDAAVALPLAPGGPLGASGLARGVAVHIPGRGERPPWGTLAAAGGEGLTLGGVELATLEQAALLLGEALRRGGPLDPEGGRAAVDGGRLTSVARLSAAVVHELNNLSMSVNGHAQLARRRTKEGDPIRRDLGSILDAGRHAGELARRLHPDAATSPPRAALDDVAASAVQAAAPLEGARVTFRAGTRGATVEAEPGQLSSVVLGLIRNARAASPPEGEVVVETDLFDVGAADAVDLIGAPRPGRHARLRVSDRGEGLAAGRLAHAFEPYAGRGMRQGGLGLWATYHLASAGGGGLRLASEPGRTVVELLLPCQTSTPARGVLVVSPAAALRRTARAWLSSAGASVVEAADGAEAERRVAAGGVEQALVDERVDGGQGRALAARLRAALPRGAVVLAAAPAPDELGRPFAPARLLAALALS